MTNTPSEAELQALSDQDHADDWDTMEDVSEQFADIRPRKDRQLNLRVDSGLLDALRVAASRRSVGYHSLARTLIEEGLARDAYEGLADEVTTGTRPGRPFRMKELILLLLGAPGANDPENEAIEGRTRLQKLLFLTAQHLQPHVAARFEAYDYGPFEETVAPDIEFLADEGLVEMPGAEFGRPSTATSEAEHGEALLAWVQARHAPDAQRQRPTESYRLTQQGLAWVHQFVASGGAGDPEALAALQEEVANLKKRFGGVPLNELVDFVYSEFPQFTEHSRIRHKVAERRSRQGTR